MGSIVKIQWTNGRWKLMNTLSGDSLMLDSSFPESREWASQVFSAPWRPRNWLTVETALSPYSEQWLMKPSFRGWVVQLLSPAWLFAPPWTAARQASLSFTIFQSLLKLMSIESVMPSNHLVLCHLFLLLPSVFHSIRVFSNESILRISWPKFGASASASVLPMNIQDLFPFGLTGLIS